MSIVLPNHLFIQVLAVFLDHIEKLLGKITNKEFYGDFAKEFLNMIQKNCQNLDEEVIWKDN